MGAVHAWLAGARWRIYLTLVVMILTPVMVLSWLQEVEMRRQQMAQAENSGRGVLSLASLQIDTRMEWELEILRSFALRRRMLEAWQRGDAAGLKLQLQQIRDLEPNFLFVSLVDAKGRLEHMEPRDERVVGRDFSFRDWFRGVSRDWRPYVSHAYVTAYGDQPLTVGLAVPVFDVQKRPVAILLAVIPVGSLNRRLQERWDNPEWQIRIMDQQGMVIGDPLSSDFSQPEIDSAYEPVQLAMSGASGSGIFNYKGQRMYTHYAPIRNLGWTVVVQQPLDALESLRRQAQTRIWATGGVLLVLALLTGALVASAFNRMERSDRFTEISLDLFSVWDLQGNVRQVNPAWQKVLGYGPNELLGRSLERLLHPDDRDSGRKALAKVRAEGQLTGFEIRMQAREGFYRWLRWDLIAAPQKKEIYCVAHDVTERKVQEEDIAELNRELTRNNEELLQANREMESFTYSVSHDLRAPLRHLDGFSRILEEEAGPRLKDEDRRTLQRIRQGATMMGRMVDELLALARLGRHTAEIQLVSLETLTRSAIRDLETESAGRNVEWKIGPLPFVEGDPALMQHVFSNLLSNALKYTRPRDPAVIEISETAHDGMRAVMVRDNGVGFSMKYAQKLFGVFQRLHRAEDFEGTGIGLATVQRVLHKHGGRIWCEAELDRGAAFYFTLPSLAGPPAATLEQPRAPAPVSEKGAIE